MSMLVAGGVYREILDIGGERVVRYGGSGLTAAVAAARLTGNVRLASFVGAEDAEAVFALLDEAGIVADEVLVLPGASGTFAFNQQPLGVLPQPLYRPAETAPSTGPTLAPAECVLVFGMPDFDAISSEWISESTVATATLIWDRQGWLSRARGFQAAAALGAPRPIYIANYNETIDELGSPPALPPAGFKVAVIKDGLWGVTITHGDRRHETIPAVHVEQRSPIGSGDVFAGVLAGSLAQGSELTAAATRASAAAAFAVSRGENLIAADAIEQIDRFAEHNQATFVSRNALSEIRILVRHGPSYPDKAIAAAIEMRFRHLGLTVVEDREASVEILVGSAEAAGGSELTLRLGETETPAATNFNQLDPLISAVVDWVRSRVGS